MKAQSALKAFVALVLALCAAGFVALWVSLANGSELGGVRQALGGLPVYHADRAPELADEKRAQLDAIAAAVARHTKDRRVQAFVITWGYFESGYSLAIVDGQCGRHQCDYSQRLKQHLARGAFQEHRNGRPLEEWDRLHGLENIDFQIASAVRRARGMLGMCKTAEGALRAMTGKGCSARLPGVEKRVETFNRMLGRL